MLTPSIGVLIIAHGSRNKDWVERIENAVKKMNIKEPVSIGYLELVEGRSIPEALEELMDQQIDKIIAIPLFVSSGSTHLEEIKYSLGIISKSRIKTNLPRINPEKDIVWLDPMDDHPLIMKILVDRIRQLSTDPPRETLMLTAHGSEHPIFHELWEVMLKRMTAFLKKEFQFSNIIYGTLHPDNIHEKAVSAVTSSDSLIVVPAFLSEGYFTRNVIPKKLSGIDHRWHGETYLPHPLITDWLEERVIHAKAQLHAVGGEQLLLRHWG